MDTEVENRLKNIEALLRMILRTLDGLAQPTQASPVQGKDVQKANDPSPRFTNEYLTPDDIAKEILVDPNTVRRWLKEGELPYYKFGRAVRVKTKDFQKYMKDNNIS